MPGHCPTSISRSDDQAPSLAPLSELSPHLDPLQHGNLMDSVKNGIVGYALKKMDKGQGFLRRRLVPLQLYQCSIFILSHIKLMLRNLHTDTVTRQNAANKKYIHRYNKSCGFYSWRWSRNVTRSKTEGQFSSARGLPTRGSRCRICKIACGSNCTGMDLDRLFRQDGRVRPRCFCQMPWYGLIKRPQHFLLQPFEHTSASLL